MDLRLSIINLGSAQEAQISIQSVLSKHIPTHCESCEAPQVSGFLGGFLSIFPRSCK